MSLLHFFAPRSTLIMAPLPQDAAAEDRIYLRDLTLLGGALFVLTLVFYVATLTPTATIPRDHTSLALGRDFINFWMFGRASMSESPGAWYDLATYHAELSETFGFTLDGQNWSYPPTVMLIAAPFAQIPYLAALGLWTVATSALFLTVARRQVGNWRMLLPIAISPAVLMCLISGQSSFLTAVMLIAIVAWLDKRPWLTGILIGCLTIKPQLGLLFPFFLAASGRWKIFSSAAATTIALAALSVAAFGVQPWLDYWHKGLPVQGMILADPDRIATPFFPTVFMNLRGLNVSPQAAMAVQALFSAVAVAAVIVVARRKVTDPAMLLALFLACSLMVSPYMLSYDLVALTFAAVALLASGKLDATGRRLAQLVFWTPALQLALGTYFIPGPSLIAPAFAIYLLIRLLREGAPKGGESRVATATAPSFS